MVPNPERTIEHSVTIAASRRRSPGWVDKGSLFTVPGTGSSRGVVVAALVAVVGPALAGCDARVREERKLWNLFGIQAALNANGVVATSEEIPTGIPASELLTRTSSGATLKVQRAFAEGAPAGFVTTEIWMNFYDAVWTQPLYAQVIDVVPQVTFVTDTRVIDVGPDSTFYSPFWQVNLAVVGDVAEDRYQSTTALLNNASQIIPAGERTCPIRPDDVTGTLALPAPWDAWNIPLQTVPPAKAVLDDEGTIEHFSLFDFGPDLFELEVEEHGAIVEATPMFVFAKPDGTLNTDEPRVLGAGEVAMDASGPRPRYGGLWRLYKVFLPASAGPFHGVDHPAARDRATDPLAYEGRFALDVTCFNDDRSFPDGCVWLDSQAQLEAVLGDGHLEATNITQTGPIVFWQKQAVPVNQ